MSLLMNMVGNKVGVVQFIKRVNSHFCVLRFPTNPAQTQSTVFLLAQRNLLKPLFTLKQLFLSGLM
jgi:hypothetical protein